MKLETQSVEFYERVFANPYTIAPDRHASSPEPVTILGVLDSTILTDGTRTVEVHHISSPHANDMLNVYLPAERILFNSDIWNPEQGALVAYFRVGATDLLSQSFDRYARSIGGALGSAPADSDRASTETDPTHDRRKSPRATAAGRRIPMIGA